LNNQIKLVIKLREVFILRSKLSMSLLQWYCQCNDLFITLFISELIHLSVHMQLVSLLQKHRQCNDFLITLFINESIHLSVHMQLVSLLQRHRQCNNLLIALFISELIHLSVHMQLVSLLQWHLFSMQWFIFSSFYLSVNLIIHSHATSESATMTFFINAILQFWLSMLCIFQLNLRWKIERK